MTSYTAPMFTEVATQVGVTIPSAAMMITSFGILTNPTLGSTIFSILHTECICNCWSDCSLFRIIFLV